MLLRKQLPIATGFVAGIIVLAAFFSVNPSIRQASTDVVSWRLILAAFALVLGAFNLTRVTWVRVAKGDAVSRTAAIVLLATMAVIVVVGVTQGTTAKTYVFLYDNVYRAGGATVFSLNAFFVVSAAFRAFRVRNAQSAVFMTAGLIAILGPASIGAFISPRFPALANWILNVASMGASRGFTIALSLGVVSMGIRALAGLERGYYGGE